MTGILVAVIVALLARRVVFSLGVLTSHLRLLVLMAMVMVVVVVVVMVSVAVTVVRV